eukprot:749558-Hanusia_phi.AAC.1
MASSAEDSQRSRAAVTEAGVVAAAPLEGKLAGKQSSQEQAFSTKAQRRPNITTLVDLQDIQQMLT